MSMISASMVGWGLAKIGSEGGKIIIYLYIYIYIFCTPLGGGGGQHFKEILMGVGCP